MNSKVLEIDMSGKQGIHRHHHNAAKVSVMHGHVAPGFESVADTFEKHFNDGLELGAGFCAMVEGEVVVDIVGGHADRAATIPWTHDTLVPVYSTTKPAAALVLARLRDKGLLDFDEPIGRLWPEFAAHGKPVTIAEALSHQAGVPGFPQPIDPALWLDPPELSKMLAELAPMWPPGSASGYHPLTYGYIAGELAMRAEGRTLGTHLREDVCGPLGIDFWIGLPDSEHARCATMDRPRGAAAAEQGPVNEYRRVAFLTPWASPNRGGADWRRAEIPSANGHGTARAVASLYGAFANDGRIGGREVISKAALADLARPRIEGEDLVLGMPVRWGAGVMINAHGRYGPHETTLGHSGWGGSCGFGDPETRVSGAYVMNKQSFALVGDQRAQSLIAALYACV